TEFRADHFSGGGPIPDSSLNALAVARSRDKGTIAVTSGLLEQLDRDELQGVVAHEVAHIASGDSTYATIAAVAASVIALAAYGVQRGLRHAPRFRSRNSKGAGAAIVVALAVMLVFSIIAPILARLVQFAIGRQREYHADAEAVRLTRYPEGLIRAVEKLKNADTEIDAARTSPVAALCIARSEGHMMSGMFATHPPIDERIARLKNLGG
ncbi:MAG: peptidase M28, partial [Alphaproteobacteria bacterium]|nr:peptidase M28 [Alphaproteobacteria bacterium]